MPFSSSHPKLSSYRPSCGQLNVVHSWIGPPPNEAMTTAPNPERNEAWHEPPPLEPAVVLTHYPAEAHGEPARAVARRTPNASAPWYLILHYSDRTSKFWGAPLMLSLWGWKRVTFLSSIFTCMTFVTNWDGFFRPFVAFCRWSLQWVWFHLLNHRKPLNWYFEVT